MMSRVLCMLGMGMMSWTCFSATPLVTVEIVGGGFTGIVMSRGVTIDDQGLVTAFSERRSRQGDMNRQEHIMATLSPEMLQTLQVTVQGIENRELIQATNGPRCYDVPSTFYRVFSPKGAILIAERMMCNDFRIRDFGGREESIQRLLDGFIGFAQSMPFN